CQAGEPVHLRGVRDLLLDRARGPRRPEDLEPRPGGALGPGGPLDRQRLQLLTDRVESRHLTSLLLSWWRRELVLQVEDLAQLQKTGVGPCVAELLEELG